MDFNVAEYAITIRQSQLLRRREREWGSVRLAVEGKFMLITQVLITTSTNTITFQNQETILLLQTWPTVI